MALLEFGVQIAQLIYLFFPWIILRGAWASQNGVQGEAKIDLLLFI